jgi:hypothetical protein
MRDDRGRAFPFWLSMDYEVVLVSQVVSGLVTSARVITAAAMIMVFVFGGLPVDLAHDHHQCRHH